MPSTIPNVHPMPIVTRAAAQSTTYLAFVIIIFFSISNFHVLTRNGEGERGQLLRMLRPLDLWVRARMLLPDVLRLRVLRARVVPGRFLQVLLRQLSARRERKIHAPHRWSRTAEKAHRAHGARNRRAPRRTKISIGGEEIKFFIVHCRIWCTRSKSARKTLMSRARRNPYRCLCTSRTAS